MYFRGLRQLAVDGQLQCAFRVFRHARLDAVPEHERDVLVGFVLGVFCKIACNLPTFVELTIRCSDRCEAKPNRWGLVSSTMRLVVAVCRTQALCIRYRRIDMRIRLSRHSSSE